MDVVGLCASCQHCRMVPGERSTFYMCRRSAVDPAYPKYPRLPVLSCAGYDADGRDSTAEPPAVPRRDDKLTG